MLEYSFEQAADLAGSGIAFCPQENVATLGAGSQIRRGALEEISPAAKKGHSNRITFKMRIKPTGETPEVEPSDGQPVQPTVGMVAVEGFEPPARGL